MKRDELITRLLEKLRGNECKFRFHGLSQGAKYHFTIPGCGIEDCLLILDELIIYWKSGTVLFPPLTSREYDMFLTRISSRLEIKVPEGALE